MTPENTDPILSLCLHGDAPRARRKGSHLLLVGAMLSAQVPPQEPHLQLSIIIIPVCSYAYILNAESKKGKESGGDKNGTLFT